RRTHMRKLIATLTGLCFSAAAFGEDLLQCLDPHLVQSLIAPSATLNPTRITTDVPTELEGFVVPAGFDWIGSLEGDIRKTVALKTTLDAHAAAAAAVESLKAMGWTEAATPSIGMTRVFVSSDVPSAGAQMCRGDASGALTVREVEGSRYVNFVWSNAELSACRPSLSARPAFLDELRAEGPTLRLPEGTVN